MCIISHIQTALSCASSDLLYNFWNHTDKKDCSQIISITCSKERLHIDTEYEPHELTLSDVVHRVLS